MKICIVGLDNLAVLAPEFSHLGSSGEPVQQTLLGRALAERGHDVSMIVADLGQPDGAIYQGITTYKAYAPAAGLPIIRFLHPRWTGFWSAVRRADADVYYTSCAGIGVGKLAMFCRRNDRGLVFRLASDSDAIPSQLLIRHWRDKRLYEYGLRRADAVLAQTVTQQELLKENYDISDSIVADMLVEPPAAEIELSRRDLSVLWVGNIRPPKRPELALELARMLPNRDLHMAGGPVPGCSELYRKVRAEAAAMDNIIFHGSIPYHDIGGIFDRARVFVNTSNIEGFPNTYLQSWRRGVPVVAFFDPDGIIRREGLGLTVGSLDEMSKAVQTLLSDDAAWREVSSRCRRYMDRVHGDDMVLQPYLQALIESGRSRAESGA